MAGLILRRLVQLPIILLVIYSITLALAWAIPGSPLENPEGRRPDPTIIQQMEARYKLDSFWGFYWSYLDNASGLRYVRETLDGTARALDEEKAEQGLARPPRPVFDLGPSLQYKDESVNGIIASALPVSVTLGGMAMLLALVIGVGAGLVGAVRPNSVADLSTLGVALVGISLPSFVIGTLLLLLFSVWIRVFPVASFGPHGAVLPAITLSLPFAAYIARLSRMGLIECLGADFIRTARAKGVSETRVLLKHALKNAFLPVLSYLGPATALAMTGSFVVERVFTVPGLGQHFVNAVQNKDVFLIIGVVLIFATMLILFNLVVDVLYRWVDPRIE